MPEKVRLRIDGREVHADAGITVLAASWNAGLRATRSALTGEPRGALCAMGICHECRMTIDGVPHRRACLETIRQGMEVRTGG